MNAVEVEIIPRLLLANRAVLAPAIATPCDTAPPSAEEVAELTELLLSRDVDVATGFVAAIGARGLPVETLYLDLLAPTARRLGDLWTDDLCNFADVTIGVCRLYQVLHEIGPTFDRVTDQREHGRRALLVPVPGEQHSFGLSVVAEFFRRGGWDVWSGPELSRADLVRTVRSEWFAVVGLSVACDRALDAASAAIRAVRRASRNRAVGVMVGGPLFVEHPDYVALVGADATAVDARQATLQAHHLLALLPSRG